MLLQINSFRVVRDCELKLALHVLLVALVLLVRLIYYLSSYLKRVRIIGVIVYLLRCFISFAILTH